MTELLAKSSAKSCRTSLSREGLVRRAVQLFAFLFLKAQITVDVRTAQRLFDNGREMNSDCVIRRSSRPRGSISTSLRVTLFLTFAACLFGGCATGKSDVPVGGAAENIRRLALAYVEYAAANNGVGPADKQQLAKFFAKDNLISTEEAEAFFVSPRDNQPYVIRWRQRPMGRPVGNNPPQPNIIIFENTGADGTRYVADGRISVKELSHEAFSQAVPDHQTAAN
jgi:hypothetical protein